MVSTSSLRGTGTNPLFLPTIDPSWSLNYFTISPPHTSIPILPGSWVWMSSWINMICFPLRDTVSCWQSFIEILSKQLGINSEPHMWNKLWVIFLCLLISRGLVLKTSDFKMMAEQLKLKKKSYIIIKLIKFTSVGQECMLNCMHSLL